jgi:2-polyprenyl-6-methoxyphenol hydroxylase-like FAD-dependent oxidoreductase
LVVGGRTTGLVMATELVRHGVPVRIVDKSPGIDPHCRATVIHSRSLEVLSDVGVVEEVLSEATRLHGVTFHAGGQVFRCVTFGDVDSPFPYPVTLAQNRTDAILERAPTSAEEAIHSRVRKRTCSLGAFSDQH